METGMHWYKENALVISGFGYKLLDDKAVTKCYLDQFYCKLQIEKLVIQNKMFLWWNSTLAQ